MNIAIDNLLVGWLGMLGGVASGAVIGLFFHREDWMGGYSSYRRRMTRLGHISFFGLGLANLALYVTVVLADLSGSMVPWAGGAFIVGGVLMPVCCVCMAHWPKCRMIFAAPVVSLIAGAAMILLEVL